MDIAKRIAYNLLTRKENNTHYAVACAWLGALRYAGLVHDSALIDGSISLYEPYLKKEMQPGTGHVDNNIFGIWPFALYQQTDDPACLEIAQYLADEEYDPLRKDGLCNYSRFWVDDLYMICSLQAQAFRALGDMKYLDRCGHQFEAYEDRLLQSDGMFYHTLNAPVFWGRGNGWAAAAMTEVLMNMPPDHSHYERIMEVYKKMMGALLKYQDTDGMWHQVITIPSSYPESSCTGMFLFAMATGIRLGWLTGKEYVPVVKKGIRGLTGYVDADGEVENICPGTGDGKDERFYCCKPRSTGDLHGQAAVLWAAVGVMELDG